MSFDPDTIYKALRPVPEFDGNPNVLTRFIKICDQIVLAYLKPLPGNELNNQCLLNGILNKITGPAATIINSNGIPDNWLGIRDSLINNFADQRDETALYNDLSLATQGHQSPQVFYDNCQSLFSTIMTYVSLHETLGTTIEAKRILYKKLAMQAFVRGLREPLGSRIRCMRPSSIEEALKFVQEELNVIYLQQRGDSSHKQPQTPKVNPVVPIWSTKPGYFQTPMHQGPIGNQPRHSVPMAPQPPRFAPQAQGYKYNNGPNQWQQGRMPTRTQQVFGARPPNYNPQSNVFRLQPRNHPHNFGPKPMSGVQHYTAKPLPPAGFSGHDWRNHGNPPPSNYFKTREMNLNESTTYYDDSYYPDGYYEHEYNSYPYAIEYDNAIYNDCNGTDEFTDTFDDQSQQKALPYYTNDAEDQAQASTSDSQNFQKAVKLRKPK